MSSVDSEQDDSVWKINNEQREYYTKQFKKIQPNISEVIKGKINFFLQGNLVVYKLLFLIFGYVLLGQNIDYNCRICMCS